MSPMDYKDWTVIGAATFFGMVGAIFGPVGFVGGLLLGAGVGTKWAERSAEVEQLEKRVQELEQEYDE